MTPISEKRLSTCDTRLQELFRRVDEKYRCGIMTGHRNEADQNKAFAEKKSKLRWPNGKHNKNPSEAVDAFPVPYDEKNIPAFYLFAGFVLGVASEMGIDIRWGGDWDSDMDLTDEKGLRDLVHFELRQ